MAGRNAGEVSVRFSVENAEVVRHALVNLGKDGDKALKQFDTAAKPLPKSLGAISEASAQAKQQMQVWSSQLGPAGAILMRLGPGGLVAAAGIGAIALAMYKASQAAHEFAADMLRLHDAAETLDVTTTKLQAIGDAGAKFALGEDKVISALQKFSQQMEEFRRAEGPLFELIERIDPALARQMASAHDTARELDLLGEAYDKAGDRAAKLTRVAFGRGATNVGLMVQDIRRSGGVDAVTEVFEKSGDAIDEHMIKRVRQLKTEIDDTAADARRNFESIFSERMLEGQLMFVNRWRDLSRAAREFELSADLNRLLKVLELGGGALSGSPVVALGGLGLQLYNYLNSPAEIADRVQELTERHKKLTVELEEFRKQSVETFQSPMQSMAIKQREKEISDLADQITRLKGESSPQESIPLPMVRPDSAPKKSAKLSAEAELNLMRKWMAVLGDAATPAEQLRMKQLELAAAAEKAGVSQDKQTRALDAFKGAQERAAVAMRERLGIVGEEEIIAARLREINDQEAKGYIKNAEEKALAERLMRKEVSDTMDALRVRASETPALTRLSIDAANLTKNLDEGLSGALRGSTSIMLEMAKGTKTLSEGLQEMSMRILEAMAQALLMKTIVGPLAGALSGGITGIFPSDRGNVFALGMPTPFDRGGVVQVPSIFRMANGGLASIAEREPEAVMPLRRLPGGRLGVEAGGGGAARNVTYLLNTSVNVSMPPGASPADGQLFGENISRVIERKVIDIFAREQRSGGLFAGRI